MRRVQAEPGYTEADVQALVMSRQFVFTDVYTIVAPNGDTIRCTSSQQDLIVTPWGGGVKQTFTSKGMKVSGIRLQIGVGVDVDEQNVQWDFDSTVTFQGIPMSQALLWGRFDGGEIARDRYFAERWGLGNEKTLWMGGTRLFSGLIGDLDEVGRSYAKLKVRSDLAKLEKNMPAQLFQPGCKNAMYDGGCKLDRSLFQVNGIIGAGSTQSMINWAGATAVMQHGTVYIITASGVTLVRTIRAVTPGVALFLSNPLEQVPDVGHDFATYQGCDRSYTRCTVLGNTANYRGFLTVPTEETAL
jgi:uncharacterized phage protein (TIGR02218 family)